MKSSYPSGPSSRRSLRPLALTIPMVTVSPMPKGSPIASTMSPTLALAESQGHCGQSRSRNLQHGNIGTWICTYDFSLESALITERNLHVGGAFHHVIIRQDVAIGIYDHARSEAMLPLFLRLLLIAIAIAEGISKKLAEERIAEERVLPPLLVLHYLGGGDVDDRRKERFDHGRKSFVEVHRTRRRIAGDSQCHRAAGPEDRVSAGADHPSQRAADHNSRGQGDQRYGTSNLKKSMVHDQWPPATR